MKRICTNLKVAGLALGIVGTCTAMFYGVSSSVLAQTVTTVKEMTAPKNALQTRNEAVQKPVLSNELADLNVTIADDPGATEVPSRTDILPREEAAEIGVNALKEHLDTQIKGACIFMGYYEQNTDTKNPVWVGICKLSEDTPDGDVYFTVDAVTGKVIHLANCSFEIALR